MTPLGWAVVLVLSALAMVRLGWEQVQLWHYRATVRRRMLTVRKEFGTERLLSDVRAAEKEE